jgi:hypothetical protein
VAGFVLGNDAGGDPPPFADRNALILCPRPDVRATLPAGCAAPGSAARSPSRPAAVGDERCELPAERRRVAGAQVDLVGRAADGEPHRLIRRAASKIVFQRDGYLLRHRGLPPAIGYLTVQDQPPRPGCAPPPGSSTSDTLTWRAKRPRPSRQKRRSRRALAMHKNTTSPLSARPWSGLPTVRGVLNNRAPSRRSARLQCLGDRQLNRA